MSPRTNDSTTNKNQSNLAKGGIAGRRRCHLVNHNFLSQVGSNYCMFWLAIRPPPEISPSSGVSGPRLTQCIIGPDKMYLLDNVQFL